VKSGIDQAAIDPDVRPQDDLFAHVNGRWLATTTIPQDRGRYGTFDVLRETAEEHVRAIIEEVAAGAPQPGTVAAKVGDLYASFMDEQAVEALGVSPLADDLARVAAVADAGDVVALSGALGRSGVTGGVIAFVNTDDRDPSRYVVYLEQAGLGLPDESYYREDAHADKRTAYVAHVGRMLALAGWPDPEGAAQRVMALETRLAAGHWDKVTNRDPVKTYTLVDLAGLTEMGPGIDWVRYLEGLGAGPEAFDAVVVRQPDHIRSMAAALAEEPVEAWRDWLAWHVVHAQAPYLSAAVVEENFDFYGRTLSGVPQMRERWKRGVGLVEESLGEAVGQLYVERHFPASSKERMVTLVANLVEAYRQSISDLDWMGPDTRERALAKLAKFTPKIGYPDVWKDYSTLEVRPDDLLGNVLRAGAWSTDFDLAKIGKPVDHDEWFMSPQTVNAYYHPRMNEIVFPAAILQPPFFDAEADDAANYGGIGAVIGHEIGHGFDDQGSKYDGDGNMTDWWEPTDRTEFDRRSQALIDQYSALSPAGLPDHKVNGALTVGENIGDLGGVTIALKAYRIALGADEPPVLDGLTGLQRVLFGWAQVWRMVTRDAEAVRRLAVDPHSPPDLRCNAVVTNLDAFHEAFEVQESDALYTPPDKRVRIW
jgi:putative endopeptidase